MKKTVFMLLLATFTMLSYSQELRIRWQDNAGREFGVTAPSGAFSFTMLTGDRISYDFNGRVSIIGNVYISYDFNGRVSRVGNVYISYDFNGRVSKVGSLYVSYDFNGRITGTSGSVISRSYF